MMTPISPPLIVHIIYRLGVGGLENGLINLINKMPVDQYCHAIISLTDSTEFSERIKRQDVTVYQIHKNPGQDWISFVKVYRLLKQLQPAIVHTRNLGTIEYQLCALLAGTRHRIHGEHGWDVFDPDGRKVKYQLLRRMMGFVIHRFIPLSMHLQEYLTKRAGIPEAKITRICNGVDMAVFYPHQGDRQSPPGCTIELKGKVVIGTVGRMHGVKNQILLVKAFMDACHQSPAFAERCRLFLIGDGPLKAEALSLLKTAELHDKVWLPGERKDIADILRSLDIFVLPSRAEGISNTILEAMACGLPVIATRVGGNPELVLDNTYGNQQTGQLVENEDVPALSEAMQALAADDGRRAQLGSAAYGRINTVFSIDSMVARYQQVYDQH